MRRLIVIAIIALLAAQLIPIDRDNPPSEGEISPPSAVHAILERSCYDCHSNETQWPWYAWVAPVSWLVASDVDEAREHLNFSTWQKYTADERRELLEEIREEVESGEMPLWFYLPMHPDANLSTADVQRIAQWTRDEG